TRYMQRLFDYWSVIPDPLERVKFVLASYNSGIGHIDDARSLAEKYYADKNRWEDNVALFILRKSQRKYYEDPVVKFGYCRGDEVYNYVREILQRYENYKQFVN
ncbi:MAG: lytic transglycosylase F, partial [Calditrichaeota bacterium]|nr:lytic transglycosylase F [Calditrichota bacterium]